MYLSNFDASIICTTSKGKVQCLFLSFAQSYHIPFQMHIQRSKQAYVLQLIVYNEYVVLQTGAKVSFSHQTH